MKPNRRLRSRLGTFGLLSIVSAVSPLFALPLVARAAGPESWGAIGVGQALGALGAVVCGYGWFVAGPPEFVAATTSRAQAQLILLSLATRLMLFLPASVVGCIAAAWSVPAGAQVPVAVVAVVAGCAAGLSPAWVCIAQGSASALFLYDVLPRVAAAFGAALVVHVSGAVIWYPIILLASTLLGVATHANNAIQVLTARWWRPRGLATAVAEVFRVQLPVWASSVLGAIYSTLPVPIVAIVTQHEVAGYSSADRLYRYGLFGTVAVANALQSYMLERDAWFIRRQLSAITGFLAIGVVGAVFLGAFGNWFASVLFGVQLAPGSPVMIALGLAFLPLTVSTTLNRSVLSPGGARRTLLGSTIAGLVAGIPTMVIFGVGYGSLGVATGLAVGEWVSLTYSLPRVITLIRVYSNGTVGDFLQGNVGVREDSSGRILRTARRTRGGQS